MMQRSTRALFLALVASCWLSAQCARVSSSRRRRRSCGDDVGDWNVVKGATVACSSSDPGACSPPEAYTIIRWEGQNTTLGTYADYVDARGAYDDGASGSQFKALLNDAQEYVSSANNCGNRDAYYSWAADKLVRVHECKYPWGGWVMDFAVLNPTSSYSKSVTTTVGSSFSQTDTVTVSYGLESTVAFLAFKNSNSFNYTASSATTRTWEEVTSVTESWTIHKGQSTVLWRYMLKAKCFNEVGQYLDEVTFDTDIKFTTSNTNKPDCDPNNGCA